MLLQCAPGCHNINQYLERQKVADNDVGIASTTDAQAAISFYSYDPLGNVKSLWQQLPGLGLRQIDYDYDLASGKVNKLRYQYKQNDQFYYRYVYDAENRVTDAYTSVLASNPSDAWELTSPKHNAQYAYNLHGPLGRTLLGDNLQGIDYAYTLQGWLKGINGNAANGTQDMGGDGSLVLRPSLLREMPSVFHSITSTTITRRLLQEAMCLNCSINMGPPTEVDNRFIMEILVAAHWHSVTCRQGHR